MDEMTTFDSLARYLAGHGFLFDSSNGLWFDRITGNLLHLWEREDGAGIITWLEEDETIEQGFFGFDEIIDECCQLHELLAYTEEHLA